MPMPDCRCIVVTGAGERAFAAGADIREMADLTTADVLTDDLLSPWDALADIATPVIAAVRGFCLGGGFELALACDLIVAAEDALFGLPEVDPWHHARRGWHAATDAHRGQGAGHGADPHRATPAGRRSRALGHRQPRSCRPPSLLPESLRLAATIAAHAAPRGPMPPSRAIDLALETTLADGLVAERRAFAAAVRHP